MKKELINKCFDVFADEFSAGSEYGSFYETSCSMECNNVHSFIEGKISMGDYREFEDLYVSATTSIAEFSYSKGLKDGIGLLMSILI